jgi:hypothetical protein
MSTSLRPATQGVAVDRHVAGSDDRPFSIWARLLELPFPRHDIDRFVQDVEPSRARSSGVFRGGFRRMTGGRTSRAGRGAGTPGRGPS